VATGRTGWKTRKPILNLKEVWRNVQEIKDWNGIVGNELKVGQLLVILPSTSNATLVVNPVVVSTR